MYLKTNQCYNLSGDGWDIIEELAYGDEHHGKDLNIDGMSIIDCAEDFGSYLRIGLVNNTLEEALERKTLAEVKEQVAKKLSEILGKDVTKKVGFEYGEITDMIEIEKEPK